MTSRYGELIAPDTVRFTRLLPGPVERVWAYVTESGKRAKWLAGGDMELRVGGGVELHFHNAGLSSKPDVPPPPKYSDMPEQVSFIGEVTRCEPPYLLSHTWAGEDELSEVTYQLEARGEDVLLTLTHSLLGSRDLLTGVGGGWHTHLEILLEVLEGREPEAFWRRFTALEAEYEKRL